MKRPGGNLKRIMGSGYTVRRGVTGGNRFADTFPAVLLYSILLAACICTHPHAAALQGEGRPAEEDTTLYRVSFDRLRSTIEDGERVIYLEGGVRIDHQTTTVTSGRGKQYPDRRYILLLDGVEGRDGTMRMWGDVGEYFGARNILIMDGNVRFLDRGMEITCDRAQYDRQNRIVILTGDLRFSDSTRVMYADSVYYDRDRETAEAVGRVVLVDEVEDYSIAGSHAYLDRSSKEAIVDIRPVLTFDLKSEEKGIITSRWMHFDVDDKVGTAVEDVRMIKGETTAQCDSAVIRNKEMTVELYGDPEAANGPSGMTGKSMMLKYNDEGIERVVLPQWGRLTEKPGESSPWRDESWIEGDSVIIHLSDEEVDSVRIIGNSRAMYYPIEGEQGKVSNNFSTGDTMLFRFLNQDLNYVRISGKSTGLYRFLNLTSEDTIDSLAAVIDTTLEFREFKSQAERVSYSARVIEYFADTEDIKLHGSASLSYQNKRLGADDIDFNSRLNVLEAEGNPVLEEEEQKMYGLDMGYDMDSETGIVIDASTRYEEGYYRGEHIFKVGKDILKVYNSIYTTCDLKQAHYSLRTNKMKVYLKDKIVSGPITLYLGEIPVFYLPFMANSLRRDRHSGILRPNFDIGIDSRDGRFIRGLGYYWAASDYTDFTVTTDFNEHQNFRIHLDNRYKIRYMLDGNVRFDFLRSIRSSTNEWTIKSNHRQNFGKTASFNSNLSFVSSDRAQSAVDRSEDVSRFVDRRIDSRINFSKRWGGTKLGLSASRNQKLNVTSPTENRVTTTMPNLSLSLPRTSLWFWEKHEAGEKSFWERALGSIMFTPNIRAGRNTQESKAREKATLRASSGVGFGRQFKLTFINLSPSINTSWNYYKVLYDRIDTTYAGGLSKDSSYKNEFSMGLSSGIGTTLYGIFYPKVGPLHGIRHTFNPTATYSYRPKLSENQTESQSVSYSVKNMIDIKLREGEDDVNKKLLTWDISGSYNPKLPEKQRFSMIRSSLHTSISRMITFRLNNTYDPYERKVASTTITTSVNLNLKGTFSYPGKWKADERERIAAAQDEEPREDDQKPEPAQGEADQMEESEKAKSGEEQSWSLDVNYSLSSSEQGGSRRVDSQLDLRGQIKLTRNWTISYRSYYDLEARGFTSQQYSIKRDLHCWQASFIHRQFGDEWSYYFQIAIKSHPEVMYERGARGLQSGFRF